MQGYCNVFLRIILKQMSTEAHVYMQHHKGVKFEHFDVSNVICPNFHMVPFPIRSLGKTLMSCQNQIYVKVPGGWAYLPTHFSLRQDSWIL